MTGGGAGLFLAPPVLEALIGQQQAWEYGFKSLSRPLRMAGSLLHIGCTVPQLERWGGHNMAQRQLSSPSSYAWCPGGGPPQSGVLTEEGLPIMEGVEGVDTRQPRSYWSVVSRPQVCQTCDPCPHLSQVVIFNIVSFFWMFSGGTMFIMFKVAGDSCSQVATFHSPEIVLGSTWFSMWNH